MKQSRHAAWQVYIWILLALLPVMLLRDFTPDNELRYLSIADEALARHTFFAFTNHGIPYADKPPLYLWIVMGLKAIFGQHSVLALSLVSLLPAFIITGVMARWSRPALSGDFAAVARVLLLTCGLFTGVAVVLRMDMLMTMFIILALHTFYRWHTGDADPARARILFPLYIFLAVFTKGPMGFLIPITSVTVYLWQTRSLRLWTRYWGPATWGILLTLCAAWWGAVWAEGGNEYLNNLLVHQTVGRAVDAFHHKRPFYYYGVSVWYTLLPWTFLVLGAIAAALSRRARRRTDVERFFLLSAISSFVLVSMISSKIQIYLLPAYPFMVYLGAIYASRYRASRLVRWALTVPAAILTSGIVAVWYIAGMEENAWMRCWQVYAAAALLSAGAVASLLALWRRKDTRLAIHLTGWSLMGAIFVASLALPRFNSRIGYGAVARHAAGVAQAEGRDSVAAYRMRRADNIDAYIGSRFRDIPDSVAPAVLVSLAQRAVVITPAGRASEFGSADGLRIDTVGPYVSITVK